MSPPGRGAAARAEYRSAQHKGTPASTAGSAMLLSLGYVTVRSADHTRTERFYCDLLGMRVGARPAIPVPGRWFYVGDEAVVHVPPRGIEATGDAQPVIDHFALNAVDKPAVRTRQPCWPSSPAATCPWPRHCEPLSRNHEHLGDSRPLQLWATGVGRGAAMTALRNRQVLLKVRPDGIPQAEHF